MIPRSNGRSTNRPKTSFAITWMLEHEIPNRKRDQLVAVLTQIDEEAYSTKGKWFLETGFGLLSGQHKNFDTIEEAIGWVGRHTFPEPA